MTVFGENQNGKVGNFSGAKNGYPLSNYPKPRINTDQKMDNDLDNDFSHYPTWIINKSRAIMVIHLFIHLLPSVYAVFIVKNRTWIMDNRFSPQKSFRLFVFSS